MLLYLLIFNCFLISHSTKFVISYDFDTVWVKDKDNCFKGMMSGICFKIISGRLIEEIRLLWADNCWSRVMGHMGFVVLLDYVKV